MKKRSVYFFLLLALAVFTGCKQAATDPPPSGQGDKHARIISLSGFLTEVLFDLGYGPQIVGVDVTSSYPPEAEAIPKLGHISQLNVEGILQLKPDIVFLENAQGLPEALKQLEQSGVKVVSVPTTHHLNNALTAANILARHLDTDPAFLLKMATAIEADSLQLIQALAGSANQPKVLFIYARGAGRLMVAGKNTPAAAMIEKAGGQNAIQSFDDYQALTPEALLEAAPDAILLFETGLASLDGLDGLKQIPGITQTPAFKNQKVIAMDGHYLTAFGPRAAQAARDLALKLQEK